VRIVAVTKGRPPEILRAALEAGLEDVGENRVQEAVAKFEAEAEALARSGARRHLIGPLQSNKARVAAARFDWIQSVDSIRIARAIADRVPDGAGPLAVLVQVNAGREAQKHGFDPGEAVERALEVAALPGLAARGIMAMAPWTGDEGPVRAAFRAARAVFDRVREQGVGPSFDTLSMGMSDDFPLAVEEGSTMVRLGTALFGPR
jgi:pyridoxal phosphate enzyme (YggS family)